MRAGCRQAARSCEVLSVLICFELLRYPSLTALLISVIIEGRSSRAFMCEQNHESLKNQFCVKEQAPVINILEVQADDFIEIGDVGTAADLPQAGQARAHADSSSVVLVVLLKFGYCRRACAYE